MCIALVTLPLDENNHGFHRIFVLLGCVMFLRIKNDLVDAEVPNLK